MLLGEPPRSQADLVFSLFGIPIRVHPFFFLVVFLLGPWRSASGSPIIPMVIWIVAVFVSILWHELGHAFAMRAYGYQPWITLYGFGGLTSYNPHGGRSRGSGTLPQILITLAGPGAGFLMAAVLSAGLALAGFSVYVHVGLPFGLLPVPAEIIGSENLTRFIQQLLFINVAWGVLNLLPVYPLDGGQVAREIFTAISPRQGIQQSLKLSIFTGAALAIFALTQLGSLFMAFLFGYLAYSSFTTLQAYTRQRPW